jgi:tRNA nucleotidyltransferase/poly(A) polymerase
MNPFEQTFKDDVSRYYRAIRFQVSKEMILHPELKSYIEKFAGVHLKKGLDLQTSYKKELKQIFNDSSKFYVLLYWLLRYNLIPEQPSLRGYTDDEFLKGTKSLI